MVDLVLSIDLLAPKHILANKRQEVVHALEIFQQPNPLDPVKAETQSCARTITALLAAADRRLSGRDAGEVKGTRGDVQEFFNEVTKSLTTTLPEDVISSTLEWLEANAEHTPPGFDPTGGNNANILPPELSDFDFFSVDMQALLGAPAPTSSTSIQVPLAPVPTEVSVSGLVSTGVQSFDTDLIWGWDQFAADPGMGL
ncbi:hypothetical protein MNV49_002518 [Pseudohyphozyma bogoriensis]|nr:hypothetical protein MNV49_002518 [Pseudohyphozyma bogoriensis]